MRICRGEISSVVACLTILAGILSPAPGCAAPGNVEIGAGKIQSLLVDHIEANMPWPRERVRIFFPERMADVSLAGDSIAVQVIPSGQEGFIGDAFYGVRFLQEGRFLLQRSYRVRMEVLMDVVVAVRMIPKDREITPEDVRLSGRWFTRIPLQQAATVEEVAGKRSCVMLMPNAEVTRNVLRDVPVVRRGKPVQIVLFNGPLSLQTIGVPEEDGGRGALIRVRNVSSQKVVFARVVSDTQVSVDF